MLVLLAACRISNRTTAILSIDILLLVELRQVASACKLRGGALFLGGAGEPTKLGHTGGYGHCGKAQNILLLGALDGR
jgi:hypothetical protein